MPVFDYTVDGEPQSTSEHVLTPNEIMKEAGIDPSTHYLIEIDGNAQKSFKDEPNFQIHMHEHAKFVTASLGPTTVS
jgi:hypothetical protein